MASQIGRYALLQLLRGALSGAWQGVAAMELIPTTRVQQTTVTGGSRVTRTPHGAGQINLQASVAGLLEILALSAVMRSEQMSRCTRGQGTLWRFHQHRHLHTTSWLTLGLSMRGVLGTQKRGTP
jgi:hypothetical protein